MIRDFDTIDSCFLFINHQPHNPGPGPGLDLGAFSGGLGGSGPEILRKFAILFARSCFGWGLSTLDGSLLAVLPPMSFFTLCLLAFLSVWIDGALC